MSGASASSSWSPLGDAEVSFGARRLFWPVKKDGCRASKHREHTTAMARTGQRCAAGKRLPRHSHARHAERVPNSENHSAKLDCNWVNRENARKGLVSLRDFYKPAGL